MQNEQIQIRNRTNNPLMPQYTAPAVNELSRFGYTVTLCIIYN